MEETRVRRFARWTLRRSDRRWEVISSILAGIILLGVAIAQDTWIARAFWSLCGVTFLAVALMAFLHGEYRAIIQSLEEENARLRGQRTVA